MEYEQIAIWSRIICTVAFFAALFWVFRKFLLPALASAQAARNETIAGAERRRAEARQKAEDARRDVAEADVDAVGIIGRAEEQSRHERTRLLADADETGKRLVRNAEGELDRALFAARQQMRTEFIDKALARAEQEATRKVDANLNARLVEDFVKRLEHGGRN